MKPGRFEEQIDLKTNLEEKSDLRIAVTGTRTGQFQIIGPEWLGQESAVRMGIVDAEKGKTVKLAMFTTREDQPMELTGVKVTPDVAQVRLEQDDSFKAETREKYNLSFIIPPGSRIGDYTGAKRISVQMTTNRESVPEIELGMEALVE
jgi:hypothetical protein